MNVNHLTVNANDKTSNVKNMSLKAYVSTLSNSQITPRQKFREEISRVISVSPITIVQKIRFNRWTQLERERLSEYLNIPLSILFPEESL